MGAFAENAQECAASNSNMFESLLNNKGRKAIQIKMARAVDAKVLVDALEEVNVHEYCVLELCALNVL